MHNNNLKIDKSLVIQYLNRINDLDSAAMYEIFHHRSIINEALSEYEGEDLSRVTCALVDGIPALGILGIINGMLDEKILMIYDHNEKRILKFK